MLEYEALGFLFVYGCRMFGGILLYATEVAIVCKITPNSKRGIIALQKTLLIVINVTHD